MEDNIEYITTVIRYNDVAQKNNMLYLKKL